MSAHEVTQLFVITPLVTTYRRGLFDRMDMALREEGIRLRVVSHPGPPSLTSRADGIRADWTVQGRVRWLRVGSKEIALRDHSGLGIANGDMVLVQQALKNVDTYRLLFRKARGGPSVAMWGHGNTYSTRQGPLVKRLKMRLTREADWFFAYTPVGASYVVGGGFPSARTTVLWNTVDSRELSSDLNEASQSKIDQFRSREGLEPGKTALFLGGVDPAKGIDFLLQAAATAGRQLPGFTLLVGGSGDSLPRVREAQASGLPVRVLGRLDGERKALALRSADVLAIPEWIGLVAVDSLVSGRPIVSTRHPSHSPEAEYLEPGRTAVFTDHTPEAYANGLVELLTSPELPKMQQRCRDESSKYEIDDMAERFVEGILAWKKWRDR